MCAPRGTFPMFPMFLEILPVDEAHSNHNGGCSQMLVDGRQRPLDDTWCFFLPCKGILFFFDEAAIVLQQYESNSGSKYTLRTYHSFFPCPGQGECHARSAKFWMSANTRTLVSAPFHKFLVPYQGFF